MQERLAFFRKNLEEFARKHKKDINKNPELRHHFARMCSKIGVDPLACASFTQFVLLYNLNQGNAHA